MYPSNGHTGLRGEFVNTMQRTEYQRCGPKHRHINEFPVKCGRLPEMPALPMSRDSTQDFQFQLGVPSYLTTLARLRGKRSPSHLTKLKSAEDVTKDKSRLCPRLLNNVLKGRSTLQTSKVRQWGGRVYEKSFGICHSRADSSLSRGECN